MFTPVPAEFVDVATDGVLIVRVVCWRCCRRCHCQCCCCIEDGCKTHGWKRFEYTPEQMEERQRAFVRKVVNQVCHHAGLMFRG